MEKFTIWNMAVSYTHLLNYKKLYYEFLANHYEGVIEQLRHENQVLAQENNDLKEQSADTSIKSKFKKIVKL